MPNLLSFFRGRDASSTESTDIRDAIDELHEATKRAAEVAEKAGEIRDRGVPLRERIRHEVDREMRGFR